MRIRGMYRVGLIGCLIAVIVALIFTSSVSLISVGSAGGVSEQGSVNFAEDSRGGDDGGDDENSPTSFA